MKPSNNFNQTIQAYLEDRAKADELFAITFAKPQKSIDECCAYIIGEAQKQIQNNVAAISDAEVFGMAVHYYDEDDIKIASLPANVESSVSSSSASVELTDEEKEKARQAAIQRLSEEQHALLKKKAAKPKKEVEVQQMSLF